MSKLHYGVYPVGDRAIQLGHVSFVPQSGPPAVGDIVDRVLQLRAEDGGGIVR